MNDNAEPEFPVRPIELRGGDRPSDFINPLDPGVGYDDLPDESMPAVHGAGITAVP